MDLGKDLVGRGVDDRGGNEIRECGSDSNSNTLHTHAKLSKSKCKQLKRENLNLCNTHNLCHESSTPERSGDCRT